MSKAITIAIIAMAILGIAADIFDNKVNSYNGEEQNRIHECYLHNFVEHKLNTDYKSDFENGWFSAMDCYKIKGPRG